MSRLSTESVAKAVDAVQAMDRAQQERLADEIFRMQPNMLGSILVLPRLGVPMEKVEFAVGVLLVCFQAMKESGLAWPVITEDEQERQLARFVAATRLGEDIAPSLRSRALRRYISAHPEKSLAAYVASDTSKWLGEVAADESDKYAMLAVWNLVNCIAFAEPRGRSARSPRRHVGVAAFAPAGAPTATAALPESSCRSGGSREFGRSSIDVAGAGQRRIRACRRSYMNRRASGGHVERRQPRTRPPSRNRR